MKLDRGHWLRCSILFLQVLDTTSAFAQKYEFKRVNFDFRYSMPRSSATDCEKKAKAELTKRQDYLSKKAHEALVDFDPKKLPGGSGSHFVTFAFIKKNIDQFGPRYDELRKNEFDAASRYAVRTMVAWCTNNSKISNKDIESRVRELVNLYEKQAVAIEMNWLPYQTVTTPAYPWGTWRTFSKLRYREADLAAAKNTFKNNMWGLVHDSDKSDARSTGAIEH